MINKFILTLLFLSILNTQTLFATADGPDSWKVVGVNSDEMLNIRQKPNHKSKIIGKLKYNTTCLQMIKSITKQKETLKKESIWFYIKHSSITGWVNAKYLGEGGFCGHIENNTIEKLIQLAKSKVGARYVYGKAGPDNFDCSGFVYYLFKSINNPIPRTSKAQSENGEKLCRNLIKRGDILFFDTSKKGHVNHSGIYLGSGKFIHASSGKAYGVTISNLDKGFYKDKFYWGIRKIK